MAARVAAVAVFLLLGAGCRTPSGVRGTSVNAGDVSQTTLEERARASTLGSGDFLEVRVFQEPDLSGAFRVSPEGNIDYPLCGKVQVMNLTASAASDTIRGCLAKGFLKNPQVTVLVREYASKRVFVMGEVAKPGTFPFEDNMTIIQAITLSGGFNRTAQKNNVSVTRVVDGQERKIRVPVGDIGEGREKNFDVQPGDIIFVPESLF